MTYALITVADSGKADDVVLLDVDDNPEILQLVAQHIENGLYGTTDVLIEWVTRDNGIHGMTGSRFTYVIIGTDMKEKVNA